MIQGKQEATLVERLLAEPPDRAYYTGGLASSLAGRFKALSSPTRLRILAMLAKNGPLVVLEIWPGVGVSQPTTSHHLVVLSKAGLVERERVGVWGRYSLTADGLDELAAITTALAGSSAERRARRKHKR